jgi:hypothetical protein
VPETRQGADAPGQSRQAAPAAVRTIELHQPRRPAAVAAVPARNGLPEPRRYVYGGTGYDQYPDLEDDGR